MSNSKAPSLYSLFQTNKSAEQDGIDIQYGDSVFKIARAGGANTAFNRRMEALFKPYRRQIQNETMDKNLLEKLTMTAFAETVVLDWENVPSKVEPMPYSPEAAMKLFEDLPDLYADLFEQAGKAALFREDILEADSKN